MKKIYLFAAIMAVITAFAVYNFTAGMSGGGQNNVATVTVVSAKLPIPENIPITEDMLQTVTMPATSATGALVQNTADAVGKVCPYPIAAGEFLYSTKLYTLGDDTKTGMSYSLEKGKRAVTLRVDDLSGVGYYIKSGDFVDVISIYTDMKHTPNITYTDMIFENVKVLKIGNKSALSDKDISEYTTVTLEVTPADALKLTHFSVNGKIILDLRPTGDDKIVKPSRLS